MKLDLEKLFEDLPEKIYYPESDVYSMPRYEKFLENLANQATKIDPESFIDQAPKDYPLLYKRSEAVFPNTNESLKKLNETINRQQLQDEAERIHKEGKTHDLRFLLDRLYGALEEKIDPNLEIFKKKEDLTIPELKEIFDRRLSEARKFWNLKKHPELEAYEYVDKNQNPEIKYANLLAFVLRDLPNKVFLSDKILLSPDRYESVPFHEVTHFVKDAEDSVQKNFYNREQEPIAKHLADTDKGHFISGDEEASKYQYGDPGLAYDLYKLALQKLGK